MASVRSRVTLLLLLLAASACTSATDRLNDGIALQSQGRYIQAVYSYADAYDRDRELVEARDRLLAAGDSAVAIGMDEADRLERRGDPVAAAAEYSRLDAMLQRVRQVGLRIDIPADYSAIRRAIFDTAINWQMVQGDEAAQEGRWEEARAFYRGARGDYLPSRTRSRSRRRPKPVCSWIGLGWSSTTDGRDWPSSSRRKRSRSARLPPVRQCST